MKKKIFCFALLATSILFTQCKRSQESQEKISMDNLSNDRDFQSYIYIIQKQIANITDIALFKRLSQQGNLSDNDIKLMSKEFGYLNESDFYTDETYLQACLKGLKNKYNFSGDFEDKIGIAVQKTFLQYNLLNIGKTIFNNSLKNIFDSEQPMSNSARIAVATNCNSDYNNCIVNAAAQAVIMNIGCGSVDLTIVLGIICHAAVITYQITQSNLCYSTLQNCLKAAPTTPN